MAFLVTDEVLENIICDTCHKFLSVRPIKVYPNRKIKCGRCSEEGDDGVVSLFNLLADQCIFKCVNRFDGCRKLLTYSEVSEHESECVGKSYICPICPVSTMVPTFLIISHFKKKHKSMYLETSSFFIDLNVLLIIKYFLYRHQDRLFIVMFKTNASSDYITMSCMLLGDPEDAGNISQRFTLCTSTGFEIHSREITCKVYPSDGGWNLKKSEVLKYSGTINLTFTMNMINIAGLINLPGKFHSLDISQTVEVKKNCFTLRNIFLDESFRKTYPEFSIGSNFTSLIKTDENKIESEIVLSCINCSVLDYSFFSDKETNVYTIKRGQKYFLECHLCPINRHGKVIDACYSLISVETFKKICFFCVWKCGNYSNIDSLNEHEMNCSLRPFEKCPVRYCNYKNKLSDIKKHIVLNHSEEYSITTESPFNLSLLIGKSPIKQIVIVEHKFILMELVWIELRWKILISKCNPSEHCDRLIAVALMFDESETLFSTHKENKISYIHHREQVLIKFYFEMIDKQV